MTRITLGFLAGLFAIIGSALVLWFTMPFVFSAVNSKPESWLGLFPFFVFVPALLIGGYTAARFVSVRRVILGFAVGLIATILVCLLVKGTGHAFYLSIVVLFGGGLSAIGAHFAGKHAVNDRGHR